MVTRILFSLIALCFLTPQSVVADEDSALKRARQNMVAHDLKGRDINDPRVLRAMGRVPRHRFLSRDQWSVAYGDTALPIAEGQTISQPYVVALMTQSLGLKSGEKVLEIGTGSGYQAAILAELNTEVYTIEIRKGLADRSKAVLKELGYDTIEIRQGDGYFGWSEQAPFDAVIVTCAANHIPPPLIEQLRVGGRLIIPLGSTSYWQTLTLIEKRTDGLNVRHLGGVLFVPMVGRIRKDKQNDGSSSGVDHSGQN